MNYGDFKKKTSEELNAFTKKYCFWAFGRDQLNAKLQELGITEEEMRQKYVGFYGGAILADKVKDYEALSDKHFKQLKEYLKDEKFAYSAFRYELSNHEYGYTYDEAPALRALCLTARDVSENETLRRAFVKAAADVKEATC